MRIATSTEDLVVRQRIDDLRDEVQHLRKELQVSEARLQLAQAELLNAYKPKPEPVYEKPNFQMPNVENEWESYRQAHMDRIEKAELAEQDKADAPEKA